MTTKDYIIVAISLALGILIGWLIWHGNNLIISSPNINAGEHWVYQDDVGNPFNQEDYFVIDEVKNGWVQFHFVWNGKPGRTKYTAPTQEFIKRKARIKNDTN